MVFSVNPDEFRVEEMTEEASSEISRWKYPVPYEIYSFSDNEAEREELQNGLHFAVYCDSLGDKFVNLPCGFIAIGWSAQIQDRKLRKIYDDESYTDIAFGLHPELCGKGFGAAFIKAAMIFARELFEEEKMRLTVDSENKRACRLYEKIGFQEIHAFKTRSVDAAKGKLLSMKIMILDREI